MKTEITKQAVMEMINGIPRRNRLDLNTSAELAIYNAIGEVEKCGASVSLTKVVTLLQEAKNALADHIEGIESKLGKIEQGKEAPPEFPLPRKEITNSKERKKALIEIENRLNSLESKKFK